MEEDGEKSICLPFGQHPTRAICRSTGKWSVVWLVGSCVLEESVRVELVDVGTPNLLVGM